MASGESGWVTSVVLPATAARGVSCPSAAPQLHFRVVPIWRALSQEHQAAGRCALAGAVGEALQQRSRARAA